MREGFTLVELLVVIAIIAALAGFAIANLGSAEKATQAASMKADARSIVMKQKINGVEYGHPVGDDTIFPERSVARNAIVDLSGNNNSVELSPNNGAQLLLSGKDFCDNGQGYFVIKISSSKVPGKIAFYDSCNSASVQMIDGEIEGMTVVAEEAPAEEAPAEDEGGKDDGKGGK